MAFNPSGMDHIAVGPTGLEWWDYKTADTLATVESVGYFNSYAKSLNLNDKILVTGSDNGAFYFVSTLNVPFNLQGVTTTGLPASVIVKRAVGVFPPGQQMYNRPLTKQSQADWYKQNILTNGLP